MISVFSTFFICFGCNPHLHGWWWLPLGEHLVLLGENLIWGSLATLLLVFCVLCGKYGLSVVLCLKEEIMSDLLMGNLNISNFVPDVIRSRLLLKCISKPFLWAECSWCVYVFIPSAPLSPHPSLYAQCNWLPSSLSSLLGSPWHCS